MNNIKSNTAKSLLLIAILCTTVFADGEQGSGGFTADQTCVVKSDRTLEDGEQGSGGLTSGPCEESGYIDSVMSAVYDYFEAMI